MYEETKNLLAKNRTILDGIAYALMDRESIGESELNALIQEYSICA